MFAVNEEPYCLWGADISAQTRDFLDGLDAEYFEYSIKVHMEAEDEQRASVALSIALHHALETLFSLLCAFVQAPDCPHAWIAKCSNGDLRALLARISKCERHIFTKLSISSVTWIKIAESVFKTFKPGTDQQKEMINGFGRLWARLAMEVVDPNRVDEYNSLKHGLRVRQGGFAIAVGLEPSCGVVPPPEQMKVLGKSKFGSSFFTVEPAIRERGNRSILAKHICINWSMERIVLLNQLAYISISNIISALRIINGASSCKFLLPSDSEDFERPWTYSPGVTRMALGDIVEDVPITTKGQLQGMLKPKT